MCGVLKHSFTWMKAKQLTAGIRHFRIPCRAWFAFGKNLLKLETLTLIFHYFKKKIKIGDPKEKTCVWWHPKEKHVWNFSRFKTAFLERCAGHLFYEGVLWFTPSCNKAPHRHLFSSPPLPSQGENWKGKI